MTAPQEAGGPGWLDMSRYPDTDPDTVLSSDDHSLLTTSLAVDDTELPDSVWEHMLAVVVGDPDAGVVDASAEPQADGDDWSDGADGVVAEHHAEDPADDPAAHDPGHDPAHDPAWHDDGSGDGGWV